MIAIKTPKGTVLFTGDFKIDYTPIDGQLNMSAANRTPLFIFDYCILYLFFYYLGKASMNVPKRTI